VCSVCKNQAETGGFSPPFRFLPETENSLHPYFHAVRLNGCISLSGAGTPHNKHIGNFHPIGDQSARIFRRNIAISLLAFRPKIGNNAPHGQVRRHLPAKVNTAKPEGFCAAQAGFARRQASVSSVKCFRFG
jgi:hypothetical protein